MRKMILALVVVLIAAPAWGAVSIELTDEGDGVVAIGYDATGEAELVRAFALDISVSAGAITDVTDYEVGDDNGGYGIFPANFSRFITVDGQTGEVADWGAAGYTPVADGNDTGAAGALGGSAITIEMGSLYDTAAPDTTGTLCKVVTEGAANATLSVTVNAVRGGIVLENAAQATMDPDPATVVIGGGVCVPSDQEADFLAFGSPDCWCAPYHCDGDADTDEQGFGSKKMRVGTNDLAILINNWGFNGTEANFDPCADVDHKSQGFGSKKMRVGTNDLTVLINNWSAKTADLAGTCPR
jgi:hypothetical protein